MSVTLSDGREITVDLKSFTIKEYRAIFDRSIEPAKLLEVEDELISRACGLTVEEYQNLPYEKQVEAKTLDNYRYLIK